MIRWMQKEDVHEVVTLYKNYMCGSFFAKLEEDFLTIIFEGLIGSSYGISYVYKDGGKISGFIMATTDTKKLFNDILKKRWWVLLRAVLVTLTRKPRHISYVIESFFYSKKTHLIDTRAELLFITIELGYRERNLSKELVKTVLAQFHERSIFKIKVTIQKGNYVVKKLLKSLEFNQVYSFSFYGKKSQIYEVDLADDYKYI
ncbi:MAG: hypothetical protein KAR05_00340 [Candidatus Omnitrophica bacterium]|nr:hypothetical protein [Candidatus Omnitrophota bacterium]